MTTDAATCDKKFNAQRAACAGPIEGTDYRTVKTAEEWTWQRKAEKPKAPIVEAIDAGLSKT